MKKCVTAAIAIIAVIGFTNPATAAVPDPDPDADMDNSDADAGDADDGDTTDAGDADDGDTTDAGDADDGDTTDAGDADDGDTTDTTDAGDADDGDTTDADDADDGDTTDADDGDTTDAGDGDDGDDGSAYPPISLGVSSGMTDPAPGEAVTFFLVNCNPGDDVVFTLSDRTTDQDSDGGTGDESVLQTTTETCEAGNGVFNASTTITAPAAAGDYTVTATSGGETTRTILTVVDPGTIIDPTTVLPVTGTNTTLNTANTAAIIIGVGIALIAASIIRRRKPVTL